MMPGNPLPVPRGRRWLSASCATLVAVLATEPLVANADPVADFVNGYLKKNQIPGCAIMVRKEGKLVHCAGYGVANLEHDVKVTPQTVFQSGSIGKQFTSMAVMMLVEEGKLSLGDPVSKFLEVPSSWSKMTVRHLLTHTSGLGDYPEDFSLQVDRTEAEMLKMIVAQPLAFSPGDKWSYSNLGYVTLGILIRKVTGEFYGDLLQNRVFEKLGMKPDKEAVFFHGTGCDRCKGRGYLGRVAIIEALPVSEAIRRLIIKRASSAVIKNQAMSEGMKTLRMVGVEKASEGVTTLEEVWRVTSEDH